jgi:SAM-dependent methyltransferase
MPRISAETGRVGRNVHSHAWIVGVVGLIVGLALLVYVPSLKAVSRSLLLFAGFHLIGGLIVLASAYSLFLRRAVRRLARRAEPPAAASAFDFGWGPEWMNGLAFAALAAFASAVAAIVAAPAWWPAAFALVLLGALFGAGNAIMRVFQSRDCVVLPMAALLRSDRDLVLDAGCGAGRTTIALSSVLGEGRVIALDRFDTDYIDDGGRALLDRNLKIAGLADKVSVVAGDLSALPFDDNHFDAAVSTNVFDHLGDGKQKALEEVMRVLKPGGRFLMAVWTPSWPMFAVANIFSFFLTRRAQWRAMAEGAGFRVVQEGVFNFAWFALFEKSAAADGGRL